MDLNYLLARHQISLVKARRASCEPSRTAHLGLARGYAGRIDTMRELAGARGRVIAA